MGLFEPSAGDFWEMKEKEEKEKARKGAEERERAAIRRFPPMRGPGRISRGAIRARRMRADGRRRLWDLTGMCIGAASRCVILTRSVLWCLPSRMRCRLRSGSFIRGRLRLMRGP